MNASFSHDFFEAIEKGDVATVKRLVSTGAANPKTPWPSEAWVANFLPRDQWHSCLTEGSSAVTFATRVEDEFTRHEILEFLLPLSDLDQVDKNHHTALTLSALQGNAKTVELLLSWMHPNATHDPQGRTALMWAASHGHAECVRVLLGHPECNPAQESARPGLTAWDRSVLAREWECAAILARHTPREAILASMETILQKRNWSGLDALADYATLDLCQRTLDAAGPHLLAVLARKNHLEAERAARDERDSLRAIVDNASHNSSGGDVSAPIRPPRAL